MELWIRSQDKRILAKVDNVYVNANYDNKVICYEHSGEDADLGHYATKERALEVLDEINRHIEELYNFKYGLEYDLSSFTYEMPKE